MAITGQRGYGGVYDIEHESEKYKFPSVTTILSLIKDPDVEDLHKIVGDDQFKIISNNAADRGSVMHMFLENYTRALMLRNDADKALLYTQKKTPLTPEFSDIDPKLFNKGRNLFYNIYHSEFRKECHKPLLIEGLMVSFKYKYAGRTDIVYANDNSKIIVGDYKSSSKELEQTSNKIIKYKLQLAAYINAFEEMYKTNVHEGVVWVSSENRMQKITLTKYEYPIYLNYFLHLVKTYTEMKLK